MLRQWLRDSRLDFTLPSATGLISQAGGDELDSPNIPGAQLWGQTLPRGFLEHKIEPCLPHRR